MLRAHIHQFMTPLPHTIGREQTLQVAREMMQNHRVRHLPVLQGGTLLGVVSDRDLRLVESITGVDPKIVKVEEAMAAVTFSVSMGTPLREVVLEMVKHKYGSALVVDGPKVVRIFTTIDALEALLELGSPTVRPQIV